MKNKKPIRLLCVGNFDSSTGYAWLLIESLWVKLMRLEYVSPSESFCVYPTVSKINPEVIESGAKVFQLDFRLRGLQLIPSLLFVFKNRINAIYLTDRQTFGFWYAVLKAFGVKIIVHDHTPGYRPPVKGFRKVIKKAITDLRIFNASGVIGVSPYVCERLVHVNCMPRDSIHLVTNGISPEAPFKKYKLCPDKKIRIVSVGRVIEYKGLGLAIDAICILVNEYDIKNLEYHIIGDGPDMDRFQNKVKDLGLEKHVLFLGKIDNVADLLPSYDLAFHPSKGEAMCLSIVEYMRAAIPLVVSTNISVNSILEENDDSLFYEEGSAVSAADRILKLIQSYDLRKEMGMNARENYLSKYTADRMTKEFASVTGGILNR